MKNTMTSSAHLSFESPHLLSAWLAVNHAAGGELWVRIYKKGAGTASVTWQECVIAAIAWGWIDGQKKSLDDTSYLQRLTPRRARSNWSRKNRETAERLISEGKMQPPGFVHVEAAQKDGRWDNAYAGSSDMVIPKDFLAELEKDAVAKEFYNSLNRANRFAIYLRLQTAKQPETRERRMQAVLTKLGRKERIT
jgi:uncharacterized protein YdeI (YjbR/CyaY-like superfamily)